MLFVFATCAWRNSQSYSSLRQRRNSLALSKLSGFLPHSTAISFSADQRKSFCETKKPYGTQYDLHLDWAHPKLLFSMLQPKEIHPSLLEMKSTRFTVDKQAACNVTKRLNTSQSLHPNQYGAETLGAELYISLPGLGFVPFINFS